MLREAPKYTTLNIYDADYHLFDILHIDFNNAATDTKDNKYDAGKPAGFGDFDFYSISSDNQYLSIDARPFEGSVIPLGITTSLQQEFIIKASDIAGVPEGGQLYLHDKYLSQYVLLQQGIEYHFNITADAASQGNSRFELTTGIAPAGYTNSGFTVTVVPNPATAAASVSYTATEKAQTTIRVLDIIGNCISTTDLGIQQSGSATISLTNYPAGVYMVEVISGKEKVVKQLVKE